MKVFYSINDYDFEGDITEEAVYLHFGETRIKIADTVKQSSEFFEQMEKIYKEINATSRLTEG